MERVYLSINELKRVQRTQLFDFSVNELWWVFGVLDEMGIFFCCLKLLLKMKSKNLSENVCVCSWDERENAVHEPRRIEK